MKIVLIAALGFGVLIHAVPSAANTDAETDAPAGDVITEIITCQTTPPGSEVLGVNVGLKRRKVLHIGVERRALERGYHLVGVMNEEENLPFASPKPFKADEAAILWSGDFSSIDTVNSAQVLHFSSEDGSHLSLRMDGGFTAAEFTPAGQKIAPLNMTCSVQKSSLLSTLTPSKIESASIAAKQVNSNRPSEIPFSATANGRTR